MGFSRAQMRKIERELLCCVVSQLSMQYRELPNDEARQRRTCGETDIRFEKDRWNEEKKNRVGTNCLHLPS